MPFVWSVRVRVPTAVVKAEATDGGGACVAAADVLSRWVGEWVVADGSWWALVEATEAAAAAARGLRAASDITSCLTLLEPDHPSNHGMVAEVGRPDAGHTGGAGTLGRGARRTGGGSGEHLPLPLRAGGA